MRKLNQRGMVSLLTVMLIGIILTIITTGFLRIIARNQKQAVTNQLNAQAFYAAETGIEDGRRAVALRLEDIKNGGPARVNLDPGSADGISTDCRPAQSTGANNDLPSNINKLNNPQSNFEYTCQLIDMHPDNLAYDLGEFKSAVLNLQPDATAGSYNSIEVTWTRQTSDNTNYTTVSAANAGKFRDVLNWGNTMSVLGLQFSSVKNPVGTGLNRDQFYRNERSFYVSPVGGGSGTVAMNLCDYNSSACTQETGFNNGVQQANCAGTPVTCTVRLQLGTSLDSSAVAKLRITSLYHASHVEVRLFNGGIGSPLKTAFGQAMIDVTGRAQDVFKRLRVRVPLSNDNFPYPAFGVQSADDICKLFEVIPNTATPSHDGTVIDGCTTGSTFVATGGPSPTPSPSPTPGGGALGNAGIGAFCTGTCIGSNFTYGSASNAARWSTTIKNISQVSASLVDGCSWVFRDTSNNAVVATRNDNCDPGDEFQQSFPVNLTTCKRYRADLTMEFKNSIPDAKATFTYNLPHNNALPTPPGGFEFNGPCANPNP